MSRAVVAIHAHLAYSCRALRSDLDVVNSCSTSRRLRERANGASAIAISQGIDDFSETQMGKVIAKLCSTKILFQQTIETSSEITSFDVEKIRELSTKRKEYSEFYVKTERHRKITRFYPTALEYELFTSNHNDRNSFDRFHGHYAEYFSFPEIMDRYVDFKYYFGGMSA